MSEGLKTVPLYGGAMSMTIPVEFHDASNFRQVPDHQEVFVHQETGSCLILELNARQDTVPNETAGKFFFEDLAKASEAKEFQLEPTAGDAGSATGAPNMKASPDGQPIFTAFSRGKHLIAKFNEEGRENTVQVELVCFRVMPPVSTDIVLSFAAPLVIAEGSSEAEVVRRCLTQAECSAIHQQATRSLTVNNWGLFVPEP